MAPTERNKAMLKTDPMLEIDPMLELRAELQELGCSSEDAEKIAKGIIELGIEIEEMMAA